MSTCPQIRDIFFSPKARNLGFILDSSLSKKDHVSKVCQLSYFELKRIGSIRNFLSVDATKILVTSCILSRLDYCNSLLIGSSDTLIDRLQKIQNNAARLIFRLPKSANISQQLMSLHWLPVKSRIQYKIASLCYHSLNNTAPSYLSDLVRKDSCPVYNTRSSSDPLLLSTRPAHTKKTLGDRSFSYAAPAVWNSLPLQLRSASSLSSFKSGVT